MFSNNVGLFSNNVGRETKQEIKEIWRVQSIHHHDKYLELPSFLGRSNINTFREIKEKVWAKFQPAGLKRKAS